MRKKILNSKSKPWRVKSRKQKRSLLLKQTTSSTIKTKRRKSSLSLTQSRNDSTSILEGSQQSQAKRRQILSKTSSRPCSLFSRER